MLVVTLRAMLIEARRPVTGQESLLELWEATRAADIEIPIVETNALEVAVMYVTAMLDPPDTKYVNPHTTKVADAVTHGSRFLDWYDEEHSSTADHVVRGAKSLAWLAIKVVVIGALGLAAMALLK